MNRWMSFCLALLMESTRLLAHLPIDPPPNQIATNAEDCQSEQAVLDLKIDLVVDDSISMAGFVRVSGGNYRRALSAVTELRVVPKLTIRRLSRPMAPIASPVALFTEDFYGILTTPLQNA